jgi:hypothetical protein
VTERDDIDISNTGLLTWTPQNGDFNSGLITITAADGGEDNAEAATQSFTISADPVNDAPEILSVAPTQAILGVVFGYQVEVFDPDDANNGNALRFNLSAAPDGMTVSDTGLIEWQPSQASPEVINFVVSVSDGGEDGVGPVMQMITLQLVSDSDGDGLDNIADNCPQIVNADQLDFDSDGQGDVCDDDDDNDSISDELENQSGLDPFDPSDATEDADGDGLTNAEEAQSGGDLLADDVPPSITVPRNIILPSTGRLTSVELGVAVSTDALSGPLSVTSDVDGNTFEPGRHEVTWRAVDAEGNVAEGTQFVEVLPIISVPYDQVKGEGSRVRIRLALNGEAPNDSASVSYSLSGTANSADHTLAAGRVDFIDGFATIEFDLINDFVDEPDEILVLNFFSPSDAVLGEFDSHVITIVERNLPPVADLSVTQAGQETLIVSQSGGGVLVEAQVDDPNGDAIVTIDWGNTDAELLALASINSGQLSFNPATLAPGFYEIDVRVSDLNDISVATKLIELSADAAAMDSDADGIDDRVDVSASTELLQIDMAAAQFIEVESFLSIELGNVSRRSQNQIETLTIADLAMYSDNPNAVSVLPVGNAISPIYDFRVNGLDLSASARIVLPLTSPLGTNSRYEKYVDGIWLTFVEDDENLLESSPMLDGLCPGPSSDLYSLGLNEGDQCVRLTIQDGGANDADGFADGVVTDPGIFVESTSSTNSGGSGSGGNNVPATNSGGGGGSASSQLLWILLGLLYLNVCRRRWIRREL